MGRVPKKYGNDENGVKKGPWSAEEDEKLVAYIMRYGIWNWNQMPKPAGLSRTGKSCRLRWMNYLRPNIRHGNITKEEEEIIMKWHQVLGNRWSAIAAKLHGRTDNEVKNYWNTRIKRRYEWRNIHPNAVNPPNFAASNEKKSIQHSIGISMTPVPNGSAHVDQLKPNESVPREAPTANDFCSSSTPWSSSNDTSSLSLDDYQLQTLMMQMFPVEEDTYMALNHYNYEKSGYTSTLVASQDIDGTADLIDQYIIFDLWES